MSRSAAKSRADKQDGMKSAEVTPPPLHELKYLSAGRFTQAQWMDMLIQEEEDEIVGEVMDELLSKVMERCLKVDIDRQIAHFSVSWARSYITQTVEHQILCPDEGEEPEEASKTEDSEPFPAVPDSWAPGCVPVVTSSPLQQEADIVCISIQEEPGVNLQCNTVAQTNSSLKQSEKETSPRTSVSDKYCNVLSPRPPPKKKKQQVNVSLKPVPGKLLPSLSLSAEKKNVELESKSRVHFYNPKPIPKIDPSSLPRYSVVPQYEIVDNNCPKLKKPSGRSKLDLRNKQQTAWTATSRKPLTSFKDKPAEFQRSHDKDFLLKKWSPSTHRKEGIVSSGSLRLDKMVLAKGVTLLDPKAAEMNPLIFNSIGHSTNMRPIPSDVAVPLISADQLTTGPPPKITPLFESRK